MKKLSLFTTGLMALYVAFRTYAIYQGYNDFVWSYVFVVFALGFNVALTFALFVNQRSGKP